VDDTKVYVRYQVHDKPGGKVPKLEDVIQELYHTEKFLRPQDTLIVILDDEPNDSLRLKQQKWLEQDGIFVVIHSLARLQFNILKHTLTPAVTKLSPSETKEFMESFFVQEMDQLPEIGRFDPVALAICLRPGEICKFDRSSPTALKSYYYRFCV
jgi:DNA-directed RNA polymerase subunit H (RpoH/RPB5)